MIAGTLEIQLLANMARLQKDMDDAKRAVGGAMASISSSVAVAKGALIGLGAVGLAASFASSIKGAIDLADSLNKLSQRTGIATESLSQLQYVAKLADVSADSLTTGIKKLNISMAAGAAGDKTKLALFKELGVTLNDTSGRVKTADEVLLGIADAFAGAKDGAGKTAVAVALLGKAGDEMIPLLNGGSQAIIDMKKEADKLGLTIGGDFAKQAEEFNDNLMRVQVSSQKLAIGLAGDLVKGLGLAMKAMADATIEGGKLYGIYKGLQTLLTGDDRHKNNVALVKDTDALFEAESKLARLRGNKTQMAQLEVPMQLEKINEIKARLATTMAMRKSLEEEEKKSEDAKTAATQARTEGRTLNVPGADNSSALAASELKLYTSSLQALEQQLGKANEQTQEQKTQYQLLSGSLQTLSAAHGKHLLQIAKEIDLKAQWAAVSKAALDYAKALTDEQLRADEVVSSFNTANSEYLQQLQFEINLVGLTAGARELATAERKLDMEFQQKQIGLNETELATLTALYKQQRAALPGAIGSKVSAEGIFANQEEAKKKLDAFFDPTKAQTFGEALKGAFGGAADSMGRLSSVLQEYGIKQAEIDKARTAASVAYANDSGKLAQAQQAISEKEFATKINGYADMTGAAKGFFAEGSNGYKTLDGVSKAFHAVQTAMNLVQMGQLAVKAVLNQASGGDVYSALPRMAAMAAAVGALGFAVGGGFNSSGSATASAADRQKAQGTGTVLGDSAAKSDSLLAALKGMESNTFTQLKYSSGMLDALKSIQRSMAGLAQIIFRTNGLTSGNPFGVKEGTVKQTNGNPLLDAVGAPTLESLFTGKGPWSKVSTRITDSGLGINGTLGDVSRGGGFSQYTDVETTKSGFFGLIKKSSTSTQQRALARDVADQLASVFAGISNSLQIATTGFGADAASIAAQLSSSIISIPAVSLRGLKGAELQEALNAVFSGAADKLARTVSPGFEALQKAGEGYYETVIRASNALTTANGQLARLQMNLFGVSTAGAVAATKLADLFGGINEFNAASQVFYQDYFSEAERAAQSTKEMAQALATVNLSLPGSKAELRALAGTLDLNGDAGRKAYAVLLAIAPEFSATADLIAKAAQDTAKVAQDTAGKLLKAFTTDSIDFAGLRTALAGQTTEVFVSVIGGVFEQLAGRIKTTIDGIANERAAVRDAMLQINSPGQRSRSEIATDIARSKIDNPSNERATYALMSLRDAELVQKHWVSAVTSYTRHLDEWTAYKVSGGDAALADPNIARANEGLAMYRPALAAADVYLANSTTEARAAQLAYAGALQTFAIDASKAVGRLGKLREETLKYYEAQKQLADLMGNSAKGLRESARLTRVGQLDSRQSLVARQAEFGKNYSLALSTMGAAQAGYADKLAATLPDLSTALMDTASTREEWALSTASLLAQSDKVAGLLETGIPKDYAAESLSMLGQIDAALVALDQSSKSAEKIISDAVNAGSDKTANGLRAVIAALTGQSIPAFATGGDFGGGLRIVGENGPELEATGPSRIFNASQTRSMLNGGGNTERLEALVENLTREVEGLRFEARATATHTSATALILKRVTPDGDAVATRVAV